MPGLVELGQRVVPRLRHVPSVFFGLAHGVRQKIYAARIAVFLDAVKLPLPLALRRGARRLRLQLAHHAVGCRLLVHRRGLLLRSCFARSMYSAEPRCNCVSS